MRVTFQRAANNLSLRSYDGMPNNKLGRGGPYLVTAKDVLRFNGSIIITAMGSGYQSLIKARIPMLITAVGVAF